MLVKLQADYQLTDGRTPKELASPLSLHRFNKCKDLAGLYFICKLDKGLVKKNCQLFSG